MCRWLKDEGREFSRHVEDLELVKNEAWDGLRQKGGAEQYQRINKQTKIEGVPAQMQQQLGQMKRPNTLGSHAYNIVTW